MFNPSQADVRRFFCGVYNKLQAQQPMEAIETLAGQWITEHPEEARANGWIVSSHAGDPALAPVRLPGLTGTAWWVLDDAGGKRPLP